MTIAGRKGDVVVDTDEGPRRDTSAERLAALKPVFTEDGATTAGNAPGVNDGAAVLVLASEDWASERGPAAAGAGDLRGPRRRRLALPGADARGGGPRRRSSGSA